MPKDSTRDFLKESFGVSDHQGKTAKILQEEKGVFSTPNHKPGMTLADETVAKILEFYESDKVSRLAWEKGLGVHGCGWGQDEGSEEDDSLY